MRSLVYLKTSDIASARPDHECSQDLARKIIAARFARPIGRNTIQLMVEESWAWVKAAARSVITAIQPTRKLYVPDSMPPRELAGCKFIEPTDANWRLQMANSRYRFRSIVMVAQRPQVNV